MAKFDQGGGCPCGLYRECEEGCAYDPDMVLEIPRVQSLAEKVLAARNTLVQAAKKARLSQIAFEQSAEAGETEKFLSLEKAVAKAFAEVTAATDALIALEDQKL